ncbi:pimeloyl-ACP methyl ester carboxylesterase [Nonlabens dokdonensis]|jgi:pimeloyl-ACP methyl ester carboxylesterase|uniref:Alpha/beta hydrolase n=2 Tax=Nonlabens dokdonensis TaxID=328515 RepID=L7WAY6_NONDD|nr:alpha/beta fold hydrolase [Nonlabens dokdonensis]AGC76078.1 alpha/beta hydrolase [Nonlabens dokdonensis DSW-6]PZX43750.1 pimeloyl-ACP methyl ester carboxylesterase [Nonlabens dokdonensis]
MFFKSKEGKEKIISLYNQKLKELNIEYSEKLIETTFGVTNIIITGDAKNPPLLLLHGTGGCAPLILESFPNLSSKYCVYAIDVMAQPTKSAENRLDMNSLEYGKWLTEIVISLELQDVTLVGFSFGGFICLKTLEYNEKHIKQVYLIAPVYIVNGSPIKNLFNVFIPLKFFMKNGKKKCIKKVMQALFTEYDDFGITFMATTFKNCRMDFSPLPIISRKSADKIKTPITIIAAEKDIMFPGKKMIKRAKQIFPSLHETVLLEGSKHVPSHKNFKSIEDLVLKS